MSKPVVYRDERVKSSRLVADALAASGCEVETGFRLRGGAFASFPSRRLWPLLQRAISEGRDWYYADHPYFGRGHYDRYRITRNAYQHDGRGESDGRRFREFGLPVHPWRRGRHIVVCVPDRDIARLKGFCPDDWVRDVKARMETDRPVIWRPREAERTGPPLEAVLDDAWALVCHESNAAIEALLHGVPVFCTGVCAASSMSAPLERIEEPHYPDDRERFFGVLADNQWTLSEIREWEWV